MYNIEHIFISTGYGIYDNIFVSVLVIAGEAGYLVANKKQDSQKCTLYKCWHSLWGRCTTLRIDETKMFHAVMSQHNVSDTLALTRKNDIPLWPTFVVTQKAIWFTRVGFSSERRKSRKNLSLVHGFSVTLWFNSENVTCSQYIYGPSWNFKPQNFNISTFWDFGISKF